MQSDNSLDIINEYKDQVRILKGQIAELEDGTKAFAAADANKLQRQLPESVLNEIELFLFGLGDDADLEDAKND